MECENCIHYKVCETIDDGSALWYSGEKGCEHFKNKADCFDNRYKRIQNMSIDEMLKFIEIDMLELEGITIKAYHKCEYVIVCGSCVNAHECIKKWLESEVEEE